ncbi:hypothetical protein RCL_jg25679.t1 [Rhizophagus clarus]|uniref:Uncharacterized protein n=1 Tax=Rhizophagus clarus TaxID=94130 RepID=A0A8H3KV50_9GLOM|nr:hypothetical protein RCL_jg25679.t1 [Rhizophagus clarus]
MKYCPLIKLSLNENWRGSQMRNKKRITITMAIATTGIMITKVATATILVAATSKLRSGPKSAISDSKSSSDT